MDFVIILNSTPSIKMTGLMSEIFGTVSEKKRGEVLEKSKKFGIEPIHYIHVYPFYFGITSIIVFFLLVFFDQMGKEFYIFFAKGHVTFFESEVESELAYWMLLLTNLVLGLRECLSFFNWLFSSLSQ